MGGLGVKTTKRQLQNCGEKGDKHFATVNKLCSPYLGLSLRNVIIFFFDESLSDRLFSASLESK
jgi:hypothetical protein